MSEMLIREVEQAIHDIETVALVEWPLHGVRREAVLRWRQALREAADAIRRLQSTEQERDAAQKPSEGGNVFADIGLEHPEIHLHWSNKLIAMQQRAEAAEQELREQEKGTR